MGCFCTNAQGSNQDSLCQGQENQGQNYYKDNNYELGHRDRDQGNWLINMGIRMTEVVSMLLQRIEIKDMQVALGAKKGRIH